MSARQFLFELVFRGNAAGAKAAAGEAKAAAEGVAAGTAASTAAADRETAAVKKTTDARREDARAAREAAAEERDAREAAGRAIGGSVPGGSPSIGVTVASAVDGTAAEAGLSPLADVQTAYQKELKEIGMAGAAGVLTREENEAALRRAAQAAKEAEVAAAGVRREADASVAAADRETAAIDRTTAARHRAVRATRDQEAAAREGREATAPGLPGQAGGPRPAPLSAPEPALPVTPLPAPPPPLSPEQEALKAQYVPMFAAQKAYQEELAKISKAEAAGALTKEESAAAVQRVTRSYDRTVETLKRSDAAFEGNRRVMKLQAHEARVLSLQMSDTLQSLALGMSPLQVVMQQGPQIIDVFGGIGNALRYMQQGLTTTRILMGGTIAAVLGGAMAWDQYLQSSKNVAIAAEGRGRRLGLSPKDLDQKGLAGAWEAGLSNTEGREMAAQLAASGQIGPQNITPLVRISKDLAVSTGVEPDQATAEILRLFAEPAKGAAELAQKYGYLTSAEAEHIARLDAQNRRYEAQAALLAALEGRLVEAGKAKTAFGRGLEGTGNVISDIWSGLGGAIDWAAGGGTEPTLDAQIAETRAKLERLADPQVRVRGRDEAAAQLRRELEALEAQKAEVDGQGAALKGSEGSALALDLAAKAPANALDRRTRALQDEIAALQEGLKAGDLSITQRQDIERAIQGQTAALYALTNRQEFALSMERRELEIATERNPLRRAELIGLQAMAKAYADGAGPGQMLDASNRARAAAVNELFASTANLSAGMIEEAEARTRVNAMVAAGAIPAAEAATWLERELALRPLVAAAARAEGEEKSRLQSEIERLTGAYDGLARARRDEAVLADSKASAERLSALELETGLVGASAAEKTRARAAAEAEKRIRSIPGLKTDSAEADGIRRQAAAEAEAQIARDRAQRAWDLETERSMVGYDAAARTARNPVARAEIEAQREYVRVLRETGDADEAAARSALVRARAMAEVEASVADLIRQQDDQIARLRLEASLAGETEMARARSIALYEAELKIRDLGLAQNDALAEQIRRNTELEVAQAAATDRLKDAWDRVRDAAEGAIDGPFGRLLEGDLGGAVEAFGKEITGLLAELAVKNPLKNMLIGTNLPTLDDVGGLKGMWSALAGQGAGPVDAMTVSAGTVVIGGPGAAAFGLMPGQSGGLPGAAANLPYSPYGEAVSPGKWGAPRPEVEAYLKSIAIGGGARPDAIAKLNPALADPLAAMAAEAQSIFGAGAVRITSAYRSPERQAELWEEALRKYGSPEAARKWVAPPGRSSHNFGLAADLEYGSPAAERWFHENAGRFGLGYRMGNEPWHIEPQGARQMIASGDFGTANAAITALGETAEGATGKLGTLGRGFDLFGGALGTAAQGMVGGSAGGKGGFLATIVGAFGQALSIPGFDRGGWTGGGDASAVAGVVHREEYVFDAEATRRIGVRNLEALRQGVLPGYAQGGYVGPAPILTHRGPVLGAQMPAAANQAGAPAAAAAPVSFVVNDYSGERIEARQSTNAHGQPQITMTIGRQAAAAVKQRGNPLRRALASEFGASPVVRDRG